MTTPLSGPQYPQGLVPITLLRVQCDDDPEVAPTATPFTRWLRFTPGAFAAIKAKLAELAPAPSEPWTVPMVRLLGEQIGQATELLNSPIDDPVRAILDDLQARAGALAEQMTLQNRIPVIDEYAAYIWAGLLHSPKQAMEFEDVRAALDPYVLAEAVDQVRRAMGVAMGGGAEKNAPAGANGTTPAISATGSASASSATKPTTGGG